MVSERERDRTAVRPSTPTGFGDKIPSSVAVPSVENLENYHKPVGRCLGAAVMEEIYIKAAGASPRPAVFGNKIPSSVAVPSIESLENYHKPVGAIHESPA